MALLPQPVRYAQALPLVALMISALLVTCVLPRMVRERRSLADKAANLGVSPLDPAILLALVEESKLETSRVLPDPLLVAAFLNMPAMLVEVGIDLPTAWPESWYPLLPFPFGDLFFWRAVSWPIYSLPFWWLAGRGADALRAQRMGSFGPRIRLAEVIVMTSVGVLCAVCGVGISCMPAEDTHDGFGWLAVPGLLWLGLGLLPLIARRRQQRTLRASDAEDSPSPQRGLR